MSASNDVASCVQRLREHAELRADKVAIRILDKGSRSFELTYAELDRRVRAVAAHLSARGAPGDRALILMPTGLDYVTAFLGSLYAGLIAVPSHPPESQRSQHVDRVLRIARDATPRFVLSDTRQLERLSGFDRAPELSGSELVAIDAIDPSSGEGFEPAARSLAEVAFLQYTSGSTSAPKGVMVTHRNLASNELAITSLLSFTPDDVMVSWLPLFHDMGLIGGLLLPLYAGATCVLLSPLRFLERPLRWLEAIAEHRGTVSGGPDFAYRMCVDRIDPEAVAGLDLSSWQVAFCGSEPIRAATLDAFATRFAARGFERRALYPCYGLAEATLLASGMQRGQGMTAVAAADGGGSVCCGAPPPGHAVRVVDPESLEARAEGETGELCVVGPSVAQGYWQNEPATAATFVTLAGERALRTGDLGFVRDGSVYVTGRLKDLIIVRGRNVYPQDIEEAVMSGVSAARGGRVAAFLVQTELGEQIGVAVELSRVAAKLMQAEPLCEAIARVTFDCAEEPARVVALLSQGGLPRTSSGKLQRAACAERLAAGTLDVLAIWQDGVVRSPRKQDAAAASSS